MRILQTKSGSFRDYYDSAQSLGQDRTLVYVRKPEEVDYRDRHASYAYSQYPFPTLPFYTGWRWAGNNVRDVNLENRTIGFCGKLYHVFEFWLSRTSTENSPHAFCYNLEEVDAFVENNCKEEAIEGYYFKKKSRQGSYDGDNLPWPRSLRRTEFEEFYTEFEPQRDKFKNFFEEHKCPLFVGRCTEHHAQVVYNGCLKDVEFYRIFDAYSAFQEISMYLGNVAVPLKPIPHVDDLTLSEAKGFDKFSFRKEPSKKKKK